MEEFKVGDRVEILSNENSGQHPLGSIGIITTADIDDCRVEFDGGTWWYGYDDIKLEGSKPKKKLKSKTTKENKMKDNGIDSNVLAIFGDKVKGNELVVIDRHFTEQMLTRILMEKHHKEIQSACKAAEDKMIQESKACK